MILEGLDTFADIYFNGVRVARNESAYMPCRIEGLTGVQKGKTGFVWNLRLLSRY